MINLSNREKNLIIVLISVVILGIFIHSLFLQLWNLKKMLSNHSLKISLF
jgi:hypothetical protein